MSSLLSQRCVRTTIACIRAVPEPTATETPHILGVIFSILKNFPIRNMMMTWRATRPNTQARAMYFLKIAKMGKMLSFDTTLIKLKIWQKMKVLNISPESCFSEISISSGVTKKSTSCTTT
ncbi:hypothetical protein MT325_m536R [Paramecium bursaria chlorella virus MT325]|uniref:Uncharacterized protein m536R n=1 Tax=Paramecium bursaria Chlorella virus MT325 TaxID=346932 RepID=A7IUR6_PBCVM|nr:hypothetical protein MT325_m536R [Paramecium bursaria chlorella virus MT325]